MPFAVAASLNPHLYLRQRPPCHTKLGCDLQALTLPEFTRPFEYSLTAVTALSVAALWWKRRMLRDGFGRLALPAPVAGLVLVFAALGGYLQTGHLVTGLAVAVGLLVGGGALADLAGAAGWARVAAALPGAAWLSFLSALPNPLWTRLAAGAFTAVGAVLVAEVDRRTRRCALAPILLAASCIGVYETVPDTDFSLVLAGAVLPLLLLAWPSPVAYLGAPGAAGAIGLLAWSDAVGGRGRPGTVIAGAACLGLLVVEPIARRLARSSIGLFEGRFGPRRVLALGLSQLAMAALCTRIAILAPTLWPDAALVAVYVMFTSSALAFATRMVAPRGSARRAPRRNRYG